jgi:hypothetical protein
MNKKLDSWREEIRREKKVEERTTAGLCRRMKAQGQKIRAGSPNKEG